MQPLTTHGGTRSVTTAEGTGCLQCSCCDVQIQKVFLGVLPLTMHADTSGSVATLCHHCGEAGGTYRSCMRNCDHAMQMCGRVAPGNLGGRAPSCCPIYCILPFLLPQ